MSNKEAKKISFWKLINLSFQNQKMEIVVPDLQRDYAEGRTDKETTQIRNNLINQICEALRTEGKKSLNFIYGTQENQTFIPIDGQQRLTTLFLLHWYVFAMSNGYSDKIDDLKRFKYATRTTTEDFCELLCQNKSISLGPKQAISAWFKDMNQYSGNISLDPSVKSMLVVLECIANTLKDANFDRMAAYLISDACQIDFLWFDIGNFNPEDLYIKMNSRGKHLTSFESFKAKLQPSDTEKTILSDTFSTVEDAIEFIGRVNNQYTNLFYKHCGSDDFDQAMMNFFVATIKYDQFAYVGTLDGIAARDYRDMANAFDGGSVFYEKFVNDPIKQWHDKNTEKNKNAYNCVEEAALKTCLVESIKKVDYVLSVAIKNTDAYDKTPTIERMLKEYTFSELIKSNKERSAKNNLKQYAIWEYIYQLKPCTEEDFRNFELWKRFVANVLDNVEDSKGTGFNDATEALNTIHLLWFLVNYLKQHTSKHIYETLLEATENYPKSFAPSVVLSMGEEIAKLKLITENDQWFPAILEAEKYFADGQIIFLLNYSNGDLMAFRNALDVAKKLFLQNKCVNTEYVQWQKLQRAALCCPDTDKKKMSYLIHATNERFHTPGLSYKAMLAHGNMNLIFSVCQDQEDLNAALDSISAPMYEAKEHWKAFFTEKAMLEKMVQYNSSKNADCSFSFTIAFRGETILLLSGAQRTSSPSAEINAFSLYCSLPDDKDKAIIFETGDRIVNENGVPLRYVQVVDRKVGYDPNNKCFVNISNLSQTFTPGEAAAYLCGE